MKEANEFLDFSTLSPELFEIYKKNRARFILRLKERVSLEINEEEYDELVNKKPDFKVIYPLTGYRLYCTVTIKGQAVKCIYHKTILDKFPRGFVTCLNDASLTPVPWAYKHRNKTIQDFEDDLQVEINAIKEVAEVCRKLGDKKFFCETDYPQYLKGAAKAYEKYGIINTSKIVHHLVEKLGATPEESINEV